MARRSSVLVRTVADRCVWLRCLASASPARLVALDLGLLCFLETNPAISQTSAEWKQTGPVKLDRRAPENCKLQRAPARKPDAVANVATQVGELQQELQKLAQVLGASELSFCAMRKYGRWLRSESKHDENVTKAVTDLCHSVATIVANIVFIAPYADEDAAEDLQDALDNASRAVHTECNKVS